MGGNAPHGWQCPRRLTPPGGGALLTRRRRLSSPGGGGSPSPGGGGSPYQAAEALPRRRRLSPGGGGSPSPGGGGSPSPGGGGSPSPGGGGSPHQAGGLLHQAERHLTLWGVSPVSGAHPHPLRVSPSAELHPHLRCVSPQAELHPHPLVGCPCQRSFTLTLWCWRIRLDFGFPTSSASFLVSALLRTRLNGAPNAVGSVEQE